MSKTMLSPLPLLAIAATAWLSLGIARAAHIDGAGLDQCHNLVEQVRGHVEGTPFGAGEAAQTKADELIRDLREAQQHLVKARLLLTEGRLPEAEAMATKGGGRLVQTRRAIAAIPADPTAPVFLAPEDSKRLVEGTARAVECIKAMLTHH